MFEMNPRVQELHRRIGEFMEAHVYPNGQRFYAAARMLRPADGPDEVHRARIATLEIGTCAQRP